MTTIKQTLTPGAGVFQSLKNQAQFVYCTVAERLIMAQFEFDTTIDSYWQFKFKMVRIKGAEFSPGFVLERDGRREFVILSDQLAKDKKLADGIKQLLQRYKSEPIKVTIHRPTDIENNILAKNLSYLYQFVLLPISKEECLAVRNFFDYVTEASIKQLAAYLKTENIIYQLLFRRGLRAELSTQPITADLQVRLGPLINSIIKTA